MYTRYYDGYERRNNAAISSIEHTSANEDSVDCKNETEVAAVPSNKLPWNMDIDDIVLIAVLFLVMSESDDSILPLILGYLFLSK